MNKISNALIVGGGVGGLSAALALALKDVEVTLIEKRPDFNVPGVGLGQPACALRVYDRLGVLEPILAQGFSYDHMSVFDPSRTLIAHHRFRMGGAGLPAFCALPRSTLHAVLLQRAEELGITIRLGTEISAFSGMQDNEITFSDGTLSQFDIVAGFDGIRSATRAHIMGDMFGPRHSGYGAWRVQAERPDFVTGMEFFQGVGGKAGAIPIGENKMYLFNIRPEEEGVMFPAEQMHDLFKERLSQFGSYVREIADTLTPQSPIVYGALEPFILPHPWHRGRVVLGGDAAHVVPPHLTAGAAMAAEDGYMLAQILFSDMGTIEDRLTAYGRQRFARNAAVYTFARDWLELEQSARTPAQFERVTGEFARNTDARITVADHMLESQEISTT